MLSLLPPQLLRPGLFKMKAVQMGLVKMEVVQGWRGASRDHRYGAEDGYDRKNEVRKERWIRKRMNRPLGGDWRESLNKARNPFEEGPLRDLPCWNFADGTPGIPCFNEIRRMETHQQYAKEIKEAFDFVKQSEIAVKKKAENENARSNTFLNQRLQPKGSKKFSDML